MKSLVRYLQRVTLRVPIEELAREPKRKDIKKAVEEVKEAYKYW